MNCTNVNLEYKSANKALTTELDRYKEEVKDLKEMQNVENSFSGSNEQYAEIEHLKQTLSEQVQEKDSLMKTVSDLKNDLKMEENRNIDREIALEKKIKQLDNIIFKRGVIYASTVHMEMWNDSKAQNDMDKLRLFKLNWKIVVTKLVAENEHLKRTYKKLYDSIKPKRVQSKEQCDELIKQVNIKSGEISDLNAKLQEQDLVLAALKNELRKLKGKALDKEAIETHSVDPKVSKDNVEPITPKLLNKRTAHSSYIKHTQEEALVLKDIVEQVWMIQILELLASPTYV
ncbi:hypothetical protein Tco_1102233 [Tanacetum coccineum]